MYVGNVYVSMLLFPFLPPSSSLAASLLYVCMSIPALQIGSSVPFFQIPYICVNIQYLFFSFQSSSLCITGFRFIHLTRTDSNQFFSWLSDIPLYICTTTSLSIHLLMTSRHLLCPSYCKQCCYEHWGAYAFLRYDFLRVYAQQWDCWVIWYFTPSFLKKSPYCSSQWLYQLTFPPAVQEDFIFSILSLAFVCRFLMMAILTGVR